MSGYESPTPDEETTGAMGAGGADAPDLETGAGGDATGGGDPGDQDAMGADDSPTPDELGGDEVRDEEVERLAEEPAGGIDGPEGFSTDTPAPAP